LKSLKKSDQPVRVAVVGVGHELRGDDTVGLAVVEALRASQSQNEQVLLINGGSAPENFTGPLRRFQPDLVLLIDAAEMDEPPGSACWIDWHDIDGVSASTHTLPLRMFSSYMTITLGCEVAVLGVQSVSTAFDKPLSPEVSAALGLIVAELAECLKSV
jgi:hydrogenase maturation protease HycI